MTAEPPVTAELPAELPLTGQLPVTAELPAELPVTAGWVAVCPVSELLPNRGAAALVSGRQLALFRLPTLDGGGEELLAIANHDPFSGANVLSRGIVGSAGGRTYVASPMFKQRFDLRTGQCLDDEAVSVEVWPVRVADGWVHVRRSG